MQRAHYCNHKGREIGERLAAATRGRSRRIRRNSFADCASEMGMDNALGPIRLLRPIPRTRFQGNRRSEEAGRCDAESEGGRSRARAANWEAQGIDWPDRGG